MEKKSKRPFAVRKSGIHGRGVFATRRIAKGERLIEYKGERITWKEADRRYPIDPVPYHTFLFEIGDGTMCLDAARKGTAAKWINHACNFNCEAVEDEDERVFIEAVRAIRPGEELTYDYNFILEERHTPAQKKLFPCWCGAKNCRGTMLGKKR
jgi:SET domain-containing protein